MLMKNVDSERTDDEIATMMARIEAEQEIKKRDADGSALIFCEQWAKCMQDMVKDKVGSKSSAFKFPWQK